MARQSTAPVQFNRTTRKDTAVLMSSARAGRVVPAGYIPLLAGDTASGRVGIDIQLKEMPRPLLNAVHANIQAWFVPKSAYPQFSGRDELNHARTGETIKALSSADRTPPPFFTVAASGSPIATTFKNSTFAKTLGLHVAANLPINGDLVDAFNLIYNFRLAAHSSRLQRRKYLSEDAAAAVSLPPAFWPSSRFASVVPDYERALVVGSMDLDIVAGSIPIPQFHRVGGTGPGGTPTPRLDMAPTNMSILDQTSSYGLNISIAAGQTLFAEMAGQTVGTTLADIDKARTTQSFAKLRTAYAGNDATGFDNDDTIVALLMQGIAVPPEDFKRPWLLDSKRVPIGFAERFASDGANLDQSVTLGRASAMLSLNVPAQDVGGIIVFTVEVLPERIDERMSDEYLSYTEFNDLPNALRDVQRVEPVDMVLNRRVDAKHSTPSGLYGYEPMNNVWNRDFTRLGGDFYQPTPAAGFSETRSNIWQTEIVNPAFGTSHYLAPVDFPHDVFADTLGDAYEFTCRHMLTISGITQIGDVLAENNDDYEAIGESGL